MLATSLAAPATTEASGTGAAQTGSAAPDDAAEPAADDLDPRKVVSFNLRFQHADLGDGAAADIVLFRRDAAIPRPRVWGPGERLATFRFDLPAGRVRAGGEESTGLADLYLQTVSFRQVTPRFSIGSGLALQAPTATEDPLGTGKWQVAPTLFPLWVVPRWRGLFFIRMQDFVSIAGDDDRRDIHALTFTPTLFRRIGSRRFALVDLEVVTDWNRSAQSSFRSNFLLGTTLRGRRALWIKFGVPWGEHRRGEWGLEVSITRRKRGG